METHTGKLTLSNETKLERAELLLYILAQVTQNERPQQPPKISKSPFGPLVLFDNADNGYKVIFNRVLHGGSILTNTESILLNGKRLPPLKGNEIERNHYLHIVRDMRNVGLLNVVGEVAKLNLPFLASVAEAIIRYNNDYPLKRVDKERRVSQSKKTYRSAKSKEKINYQQAEKVRSIIAKYTGH